MITFKLDEIILYEDNHIIILNKPSGLLSIEDGYDVNQKNLRTILRDFYGSIWAVHRLDKNTSGAIIFAKDKTSHQILNQMLESHEITKNYRGIVNGIPVWNYFEINLPLRIDGDKYHRTVIDLVNGKAASTRFSTLLRWDYNSYLDIFPKTGFRHQIRAHLSAAGFPILNDGLYWRCCKLSKHEDSKNQPAINNYYLHAYSLKFFHPISNKLLTIIAPLPFSFSKKLSLHKHIKRC